MESVVLVPVKAFAAAKARLAAVLSPAQREALARWSADRVVAAAGELPVFIACDDDAVAEWARQRGATVLWHPGVGLNAAVDRSVDDLASAAGAHMDHIGEDGALVYFGVPHPFEDDPERALHLAFAIAQAARAHGVDAALGIKTGPAFVHGTTVSGPVINQAVALQRQAQPGEILVDRNTFRRTRGG